MKTYQFPIFLTLVVLVGCSNSSNKDLDTLKNKVDDLNKQTISLQVQLDLLANRVDELERKPKETKSDPPKLDFNALKKVISSCVQTVKQLAPKDANEMNNVYSTFDAYFNDAMGKVLNNNKFVSQDAVYAFNKCMNESGFPLK